MSFFGSRVFHFELVPNQQVERVSGAGVWRSTGYDPSFILKPRDGKIPTGLLVIKTSLRRPDRSQGIKLYYDTGWGPNETTAITLDTSADGTVEALIYLPHSVRSLRWDPMDMPGEFTQGTIEITRASLDRQLSTFWEKLMPPGGKDDGPFVLRFYLHHQHIFKRIFQVKTRFASSYPDWIRKHRLRNSDRQEIAAHIARLSHRPLISVLMPVYNTPAAMLRDSIASVQAQLYPHWELCIADDASQAPHIKQILDEFAAADPRIKVEYRARNGHISAASNTALAMARGEFVALLDHDDVLAESAFYHVAAELNAHPDTDLFYSDEDKLHGAAPYTRSGSRDEPHWKSDWNPDLLYSQNYVSHLGVYRTSLVKSAGGFREGFEGSQDFDLLLRCVAARQGRPNVRHIPAVLYHWRSTAGSTARDAEEKNYATDNGIRALDEHFRSLGISGVVVEAGRFPTTYRVRFPIPDPPPKVALIIPTRNRCDLLRVCVSSIREKTTYRNYEILIVDNESDDAETLKYFDEIRALGVRVLKYAGRFNYSAINNFAVGQTDADLVGLLNNDIEVISPDWLTEMVSHAVRPDIGAVGAKLYYTDNSIQHAGVIVGLGGVAGHSHKHFPRDHPGYFRRLWLVQNLSAVTGACLIVRKDSYLRVGGLDSENLTVAFNDVDLCLKLGEAGLRNLWTPYAELYHHESASRGADDAPEKVARFQKEIAYMKSRWGRGLMEDPYYSPMLTLDWENFAPDYRNRPPKPWLKAEIT